MKSPAYQLYVRDFDTDEATRLMTDAETGLFVRCLNHSWINNGLPSDPEEIRRMLPGVRTRRMFYRDWPNVRRCFKTPAELSAYPDERLVKAFSNCDERLSDRLFSPRQEVQRLDQKGYAEKQSRAANVRWHSNNGTPGDLSGREVGNAVAPNGKMPAQCSASASPTASATANKTLEGHSKSISGPARGGDDGDANFEWFRTHYTGELSGNLYAIYAEAMNKYPDYIGVFRSNTEAWLNMPKYKAGYAPNARKYLLDGTWCSAPNPIASGGNDLNDLLNKWVKGEK